MRIILFRHGIAMEPVDATAEGISEHARPLTRQGITRTGEAIAGLRDSLESVQLIAHSPLVRARQTAELLSNAYSRARCIEMRALSPGTAAEKLAQDVTQQISREPCDVVVLIGHEPDLGRWAGWAITGKSQSLFGLKKAGACLLEFDGAPKANSGRLIWLMTAGILRQLG